MTSFLIVVTELAGNLADFAVTSEQASERSIGVKRQRERSIQISPQQFILLIDTDRHSLILSEGLRITCSYNLHLSLGPAITSTIRLHAIQIRSSSLPNRQIHSFFEFTNLFDSFVSFESSQFTSLRQTTSNHQHNARLQPTRNYLPTFQISSAALPGPTAVSPVRLSVATVQANAHT